MQNLSSWPSVLGATLLLGACQDATEPTRGPISLKAGSNATECHGVLTGPIFGDVVVPPDAACALIGATVHGNVMALERSILNVLENSTVFGDVEGEGTNGFAVGESVVYGDVRNTGGRGAFLFVARLPNGNIELEKMSGGPVGLEDNIVEQGSVKLAEITDATVIGLSSNRVAGDVQVVRSFVNDYSIGANIIGGELEVSDNEARFDIEIVRNTVGEDLEVRKNSATATINVSLNTVADDLVCKNNVTALFIGQPNVVGGKVKGQCGTGTV